MLTAIWLLPLIGAVLIAFMPPHFAKWLAVVVALAALAIAATVALSFVPGVNGFQFTEKAAWIPQLSIFYRLGVDGISLWLIVLNAFLTVIAILASPINRRTPSFVALMLAMSAGLAGVFMATDLVLFYVFWEAMLIPAYFLLWIHGEGPRPGAAALKFVLYTLAGSLLMLSGSSASTSSPAARRSTSPHWQPSHPPRWCSSDSSSSSPSRSRSRPRSSRSTAGFPTLTWPLRRRC
jgi:NADH-quinone oxidoreductase subunit M